MGLLGPFNDVNRPDTSKEWNSSFFEKPSASDPRHVDVAILWGLGMERQAHALAKQLRLTRKVVGSSGDISDTNLQRIRDDCWGNDE